MKKPIYLFRAGLLCMITLTFACHRSEDPKKRNNSQEILVAEGFVAFPGHFENKMTVTANLLPVESVAIKTPVAGTVLAIHFNEGQSIRQGQPLVQIDDRVWKAQIKGLKAQLLAAGEELKRKEALFSAEGASQEEVETIRSNVQQLEARIEELSVYVALAEVPAPFSGRVGMRDFSVGAYLSQGQTITEIAQSDRLKVDFNLPGRYVSQLSTGKEVTVIANGDSLKAPVYAINPVVDENARTIQVRAMLNNPKRWLPGDFAEVSLILDVHDSAMVIPTELIVPELGAETVFVSKNGRVVKQKVTTGPRNSKMVLVTGGLSAGDTLLTTGLMQVREGIQVKISQTTSLSEL
ncbi:MAG: efflux RND transporter periplasmic adaptor subunit [Mangrovibacterium sp.]